MTGVYRQGLFGAGTNPYYEVIHNFRLGPTDRPCLHCVSPEGVTGACPSGAMVNPHAVRIYVDGGRFSVTGCLACLCSTYVLERREP